MSKKFLKDSFKQVHDEYEKTKELLKKTQLSKKTIEEMGDLKEKSLKELIENAKI